MNGQHPLDMAHEQAKAMYGQTNKAKAMIDHVRGELDDLVKLGDVVTPGDVIGAAGRLVGHGIPAKEMATLLSTMPTQAGQGLAAWVLSHDLSLTQQEQKFSQAQNLARHKMGVAAVRALAADHIVDSKQQATQQMAPIGGQLGPQAGSPPEAPPPPPLAGALGPPARQGMGPSREPV